MVWHVRVESNLKVQVLVGRKVSFLGLNSKELLAEGGVPVVASTNVTEVCQLHYFADLGVHHDSAEAYGLLHEFELDSVSCGLYTQQFAFFLILDNLVVEVTFKRVDAILGVEC